MKKLPLKRRNREKVSQTPSRITNETVAEHRERILAGGRRFKYPMQYARHRLVITATIITIATVIVIIAAGWWQLYHAQNTSTFMYRVTRVLPLPVATINGQQVRYSEYLMYYSSSAHWLTQVEQLDLNSKEGSRQNDYIKRKSMDIALENAYAEQEAKRLNVSVSQQRIDEVVDARRNTSTGRISQETYDASALSTLGWTPSEYRRDIYNRLLVQEVAFAVDDAAKEKQTQAATLVESGEKNLETIAKKLGGEGSAKPTTGVSGMVPLQNEDGGLSQAAANLKKGEISAVLRTKTDNGLGYYFVKLDERTESQLSYSYLYIPLTVFTEKFEQLRKSDAVREYITITADEPSATGGKE